MAKKLLLLPALFLFFIFIASAQAYQVTLPAYYSASPVGTATIYNPSLYVAGATCKVTVEPFGNLTKATNFDVTTGVYSPFSTQVLTSTLLSVPSFTYRSLGAGTSDTSGPVMYETKTVLTTTAAGFVSTYANYTCTTAAPVIEIFYNRSASYIADSNNYYPNAFYVVGAANSQGAIYGLFNSSGLGINTSLATPHYQPSYSTGTTHAWVYPFNSSYSGVVKIFADLGNGTFGGGGAAAKTYRVDLIKVSDASLTNLYSWSGSGTFELSDTVTYSATIADNEEYALVFFGTEGGGVGSISVGVPAVINITVSSLIPEYVCGTYAACTGGLKQRICSDVSGNAFPDKVEFATCYPAVTGNQEIGFENYSDVTVYECKKNAWTCAAYMTNRSTKIPYNWTMGWNTGNDSGFTFNYPYFVDMAQPAPDGNGIKSPSGSLSLAMWYAPPNVDQPYSDGTCTNATTGRIPSTYINLNQSVFSDIVFPSSYMTMSVYVRKGSIVPQYSTGNPLCTPYIDLCYGLNCTQEPLGHYRVALLDLNQTTLIPNGTLFEYYDDATDNWTQKIFDWSDLGLEANHKYRLVLSVLPPNNDVTRRDAVVVMWDGVSLNTLDASLNATCNAGEAECHGVDLYTPRWQGVSCVVDVTENYPGCVAIVQQAAASGNNLTTGVFQPSSYFNTTLGPSLTAIGFPQGGFFFSPFMLGTYAILAIALIIELYIDKYGGQAGGKAFMLTLLLGVVALTGAGIYPWYFMIAFFVIAAFLVGRFVFQHMGGG